MIRGVKRAWNSEEEEVMIVIRPSDGDEIIIDQDYEREVLVQENSELWIVKNENQCYKLNLRTLILNPRLQKLKISTNYN